MKKSVWLPEYNVWFFALYGTAVGAGTLFLPIQLGLSGALAMLILLIIAYPFTYYPHLILARYVISSRSESPTLLSATEEYYGSKVAKVVNTLYAVAFLPIIFVYAITITNSVEVLLSSQFGIATPNRLISAFAVVFVLHLIFILGKKTTLRVMGMLVLPLIVYFITVAFSLIQNWDIPQIKQSFGAITLDLEAVKSIWFMLPVMVFAFSHTPIISTFANHCKLKYRDDAEDHIKQIMKISYILICVSILFFVFSCIFTLTPQELLQTKAENTTILTTIGHKAAMPWIALSATTVAIIAMTKSFLGTYFGALEGVIGIVTFCSHEDLSHPRHAKRTRIIAIVVTFLATLLITYINPNALNVIATVSGPLIAVILFILPSLSVFLVPQLKKYQGLPNILVLLVGLASFAIALTTLF